MLLFRFTYGKWPGGPDNPGILVHCLGVLNYHKDASVLVSVQDLIQVTITREPYYYYRSLLWYLK